MFNVTFVNIKEIDAHMQKDRKSFSLNAAP